MPALTRLDSELRKITQARKLRGEVGWTNLSAINEPIYRELVDCLCTHIEMGDVRYRQLFCDRAYVRANLAEEATVSDLDVQFKLCYQFLKHAFGIAQTPVHATTRSSLLIRLDTHSSQKHRTGLTTFAKDLPRVLGRTDLDVDVTFVNSAKHPRIQICDVLMGAAGSYGNKMHLRRDAGQRGMKPKQRLRLDLAKYIFERLKKISCAERGTLAFNWFESTGNDGDLANNFKHKVRIWKFVPRRYFLDRGWQNDQLDKYGRLVAHDIGSEVIVKNAAFSY